MAGSASSKKAAEGAKGTADDPAVLLDSDGEEIQVMKVVRHLGQSQGQAAGKAKREEHEDGAGRAEKRARRGESRLR